MKVWLVILNPYAYDNAMRQAEAIAKEAQVPLNVVFFISETAVCKMMHELGETGWLSAASIRSLQQSMLEGYRGLAEDVINRVKRKLSSIELHIESVMEQPTVEPYLHRLVAEGADQIVVAGSASLMPKLDILPQQVIYVSEQ